MATISPRRRLVPPAKPAPSAPAANRAHPAAARPRAVAGRLGATARRLLGAALLGLAGLAPAACAHADTFTDGVFRKDGVAVRLGRVPSGWRRINVDGADLAFRDEARGGSVLFDVRCANRDDDAPLAVLTQHLIIGTTERAFEAEDTVPFDGREALHTILRAKLDGVPMQYDIYVMKKDGCLYDVVYVAPPSYFAAGSAAFEHFAEGLHGDGTAAASGEP